MWQRKVSLSKRNDTVNQLYSVHCSNIHFLELEVHTCMESGFVTSVNEGGQLLMSSKKSPMEKSLGNDFVVIGNKMTKCSLPKVG